jgi:hypothetical protein
VSSSTKQQSWASVAMFGNMTGAQIFLSTLLLRLGVIFRIIQHEAYFESCRRSAHCKEQFLLNDA